MVPGMLYMAGNIFLWGVRFDIIYNELACEKIYIKKENYSFHRIQKKYHFLNRDRCM